jgi:hypothetical protein
MIPGDTTPVSGHYVYSNSGLSSPYVGNNSYYLMTISANKWAVRIAANGLINGVVAC